ncbi:MAG: M23 family metallopeptidase, partial [Oscillospiraceae bacterium]|nr:M23 family metallopeptidase [Oscillospiraceae bacterium]
MKMDIGNYEHIDREPRRRSFPEELREYSEEDETRKADSDKIALLFILQTFFALVLTSALVLASNGYLGDVQGVLPNEQTDDIASQTLSDIYGKYFPDADSVEDALSSILPKFSDNGEDDEESSQPQTSDEEEAHLEEDTETALLSAKEQNKPLPLLPTSSSIELSGELVLPASVTLAPVVTTAQAISPLADWDTVSVSSQFGYRTNPLTGKVEFHSGIDIPGDRGSNIAAAAAGTVTETGYDPTRGNYLIID